MMATSPDPAQAAPCLTLIAAMAHHRVIGRGNALPWHLPADLQRFKALTFGHPVIMGRKTWQSIGRPLPGRLNIVISRDPAHAPTGAIPADSVEQAVSLATASGAGEIFVIGGAEIYLQTLPLARCLQLTEIDVEVDGDAFFPQIDHQIWREMSRETACSPDGLGYAFVTYLRCC